LEPIDVLRLYAKSLPELIDKFPYGLSRLLLLEERLTTLPYSEIVFLNNVADCLGLYKLDVIDPNYQQGRRKLLAYQVRKISELRPFGLNVLAMPDYVGAGDSAILKARRFRLLGTLLWRSTKSGKAPDIKECLRFNIYGYEGAFLGAYYNVLSGTWVHPIFGIKRWYWIHPKDMTKRDWKDLSRDAHNWLLRRNIVRAITLRPGQTFVMPPSYLIVYAVQTIEPSAIVGGMF
jgi:hypothetical protein